MEKWDHSDPIKDSPHYDKCPDQKSSIFWSDILNRAMCSHCGDIFRPVGSNSSEIKELKQELGQIIAQTEWRLKNEK